MTEEERDEASADWALGAWGDDPYGERPMMFTIEPRRWLSVGLIVLVAVIVGVICLGVCA